MQERRVLVTGGSRGIGRAIAVRLANEGWSVAIHYGQQREATLALAAELGAQSSGVYGADFSDPRQATSLVQSVLQDGPLHAVVNNAGIYVPNDFLHASAVEFEATLRRTMAVNFESPLLIARAAGQHFLVQGGGTILNVASRVGFKGESGAVLYAASKAALINLTRSLAVELAPAKIWVCGIAPGWVDTAMARDGMPDRLQQILKDLPLGRMASPEDCASAAAFLLRDEASYLSGVVIDINGASYFH